MTNSLITVNQGNNLPDYLRELQYEDSGLSAGIAARAPSLGITTDKRFTITKDGKTQVLPLDPDNIARVRVVMVAGASNITKAWYAKSFVAGTREAPDCFSHDSKTPAPGVKAPVCQNCASCPKNAFGSHPVTGRGKACGDRKMTVLVWEGMPDELITFNVPTMSMQSLKQFDTQLRESRIPMQSVLVELTFDPNIQYPVVKMSAKGFVGKETTMNLMEQAKSEKVAELLREVEFDPPTGDEKEEAKGPETLVEPVQEGNAQEATNEPAGAPKRTRRTKAQIAADEAAAAAAKAGAGNQETVADLLNNQAPVETPEQRQVRELQEQLAALQKPKEPEPPVETEEEKQIRLLKEQLAALQKPKEPEPPAETPEQRQVRELQEQLAKAQANASQSVDQKIAAADAAGAGSLDVNSLLDKWAGS